MMRTLMHQELFKMGILTAQNLLLPSVAHARVHRVEGFTRNHMGKIDRAALKAKLLGRDR